MHCGMCQRGAGLLGQDGQQLDLIFRRCTGGTDHQTPVDDASVTQRERPPPPAVSCKSTWPSQPDSRVPFDVGVCRLGRWEANESAVYRPVTGLNLAGCESANGGGRFAEDLAGVGVIESERRQRDQTPWRSLFVLPGALCRAVRFIVHVGVARLGYPPPEPPGPEGSGKASRVMAYPEVARPEPPFPVRKEVPTRRPLVRPYSPVVLTGRIRAQIFGSPGARDCRCGLPDFLFGSELQRALWRCALQLLAGGYRKE